MVLPVASPSHIFPPETLPVFLLSTLLAACPANLILWFEYPNNFIEQCKLLSSLLQQLICSAVIPPPTCRWQYSPKHAVLSIIQATVMFFQYFEAPSCPPQ